jgi:hypothetical protein
MSHGTYSSSRSLQKKFRKHLETLQQTGEGITDEEAHEGGVQNKHGMQVLLLLTSVIARLSVI